MATEAATKKIGNRYLLHSTIGQGGMGVVYRATDRLTGREVALKSVTTDLESLNIADSVQASDFRLALAREFKLSASLRHPNIVDVLDYGFDDEKQPYYTMELLQSPQTILEASRKLTISERIGLVVQMLHALSYLHRRGIVHRDLKPANVLVVNNRVKVLDFGLSIMHERSNPDSAADTTVGTLAYLAPEVLTGVMGGITGDLYAVGMMAYEMIAGRHPFNVEDPTFLINQILLETPKIDELDVSLELAQVIHRLIQKDPSARYQSAEETITALTKAIDSPIQGETAAIRESFLQAARFVGRNTEMDELSTSLTKALQGESSAWLIAGESGVGKSRIIDELRTQALVNGALVMRGQGVGVGGRPYEVWQMALRWLALHDELLSDEDIALLKLFLPDLEKLVQRDVSEIKSLQLSPEEMQSKMLRLLERVLKNLPQPVVMLFEDLHWAGSESLHALAQWTQSVNGMPLLVVGSYRDDENPNLPQHLPQMKPMKLPRLSDEAISELSAAMLGEAGRTQEVVDLLRRESEGNVYFVVEIVRALAEEVGNLEQIGRTTLPARVFAGGVRTVLERRLSKLDQESRDLLEYAAVMGRELQLSLLQKFAPKLDLDAWVDNCVNAALLIDDEDSLHFANDKLRLGMLDMIGQDKRKSLHAKVAQMLEREYGDKSAYVNALAHHWGSAGNVTKEERYVTFAGEEALKNGAYREAVSFFKRAESLIPSLELKDKPKQRKLIHLKQRSGEAHLGFAAYESARSLFYESLTLAEALKDNVAIATSLAHLGNVAFALEDFSESKSLYERALELYRGEKSQAGIAKSLNRLGDIAYEMGEQAKAKELYQESLQLARQIGVDWGMAGAVRTQDNSRPATSSSLDNLKALLALAVTTSNKESQLNTLMRIARVYVREGAEEPALQLFTFLIYYAESPETLQDEAEQAALALQKSLPKEAAERAWERGKAQSLDAVLKDLVG
jgi:tetratricopeptide (TPR) repeat protein